MTKQTRKRLNKILKLIIIIAVTLILKSDTPPINKALENSCKIVDTDT